MVEQEKRWKQVPVSRRKEVFTYLVPEKDTGDQKNSSVGREKGDRGRTIVTIDALESQTGVHRRSAEKILILITAY